MKNKKTKLLAISLILFTASIFSGCAFGKFGKAELEPNSITIPYGLVGQDKASILDILGEPEMSVIDGDTEYWGYRNLVGWFLNLYYVAFGMNKEKDLIIEFSEKIVKTAYLVDKGSAIGIMVAPEAVAN